MRLSVISLLFILLTGTASKLPAQSRIADSLLKIIPGLSENDTMKILHLVEVGWQYKDADLSLAMKYTDTAYRLSIETGYLKGKAAALNNYGNIWENKSDYDKAMSYYRQSLQVYTELGNSEGKASTMHNIAVIYYYKGEYDLSVSYNLEALRINERLGRKNKIGDGYTNVGNTYLAKGDLPKAENYYNKALEVYQEISSEGGIALSYANLSVIAIHHIQYERSIEYCKKAEPIFTKLGDLQLASHCHNITGIANLELGRFDKAKEAFTMALELKEKLGDRAGSAAVYMNISDVLSREKKFNEAIEYAEKALRIDLEIDSRPEIGKGYKQLADIYERMSNHAKAYEYFKLYSAIKDTMVNEQNTKAIAEMEVRYGAERKQQEIELLTREKEKKQVVIYAVSGGMAMTMILAFMVFSSYRQKRKANRLLESQNILIQSKNKDITDSINYARRIQEAMLPSSKRIKDLLPDSFIFYQPKDIISGDFYWCTEKEGSIYIAAADCTGHGVPGALMSMIGINFLDHIINRQHITDTSAILEHLHKSVINALNEDPSLRQSKDGMDIALVRINRAERTMQYSGAVRPLYYVKDNEIRIIKGDRFSIGGILDTDQDTFTSHSLTYTSPFSFYLSSDGYSDQFGGEHGKKFMARNFQQLLLNIHELTADEQKDIISSTINDWKRSLDQVDDMLVVGAKI